MMERKKEIIHIYIFRWNNKLSQYYWENPNLWLGLETGNQNIYQRQSNYQLEHDTSDDTYFGKYSRSNGVWYVVWKDRTNGIFCTMIFSEMLYAIMTNRVIFIFPSFLPSLPSSPPIFKRKTQFVVKLGNKQTQVD